MANPAWENFAPEENKQTPAWEDFGAEAPAANAAAPVQASQPVPEVGLEDIVNNTPGVLGDALRGAGTVIQGALTGIDKGLHGVDTVVDAVNQARLPGETDASYAFRLKNANVIHPGQALGAFMEAFPEGGMSHGIEFSPGAVSDINASLRKGDIASAEKSIVESGHTVTPEVRDQLNAAADYYKKGGTQDTQLQNAFDQVSQPGVSEQLKASDEAANKAATVKADEMIANNSRPTETAAPDNPLSQELGVAPPSNSTSVKATETLQQELTAPPAPNELLDSFERGYGTREAKVNARIEQLKYELDGATPDDAAAIQQEIIDHQNILDEARARDASAEDRRMSGAMLRDGRDELKDAIAAGEISPEEAQARVEAASKTGNVRDALDKLEQPSLFDENGSGAPPEEPPASGGEPPAEPPSPVDRLMNALGNAKQLVKDQAELYTKERSARLKKLLSARDNGAVGEAGARQDLAALKGQMDRVDFEPVRDQFTQDDVDQLFQQVRDHPDMTVFDQVKAITGLTKLLDGQHPIASELSAVSKAFGKDMTKSLIDNKDVVKAFGDQGELFKGEETLSAAPEGTPGLGPEEVAKPEQTFFPSRKQGDFFDPTKGPQRPKPAEWQGQGELFNGADTNSTGPIRELKPEEKPVDPDKFVPSKDQADLFPDTASKSWEPKEVKTSGKEERPGILEFSNNLARGIMASSDMSGLLNQGAVLGGRKAFWTAIKPAFQSVKSETFYNSAMQAIRNDPVYRAADESGLFLAKMGDKISAKEEAFMANLEAVPVLGKVYGAFERGYNGLLNKMRFDSFKNITESYRNAGIELSPEELKGFAKFINSATGRGEFAEGLSGPLASRLLFAPRYLKSRVDLLNPKFYYDLPPQARKYAMATMARYTGGVVTILGLAKAAGADVETDPRSSDFAKIKVGNTRYSPLGAFQPLIRVSAQIITGQKKMSSGEIYDLTKGDFGKPTRWTVTEDFIRSKLGPVPGLYADWAAGKDLGGNDFEWTKAAANRLVPLWVQDTYDGIKEYGPVKGFAMTGPSSFLGLGTSTYEPRQKQDRKYAKAGWQEFK